MGLSVWLEIIAGVLKFPGETLALIRTIKNMSIEDRQEVTKRLEKEEENFNKTGRPTWRS